MSTRRVVATDLIGGSAIADVATTGASVTEADGRTPTNDEIRPETADQLGTEDVMCDPACDDLPKRVRGPEPPSPERSPTGRDGRGRFTAMNAHGAGTRFEPGNALQLRHGGYSRVYRQRLLTEARAVIAEESAAIVRDKGGAEALSAVLVGAITRLSEVDVLMQPIADELLARGPLTPRGKARASLGAYLQLVDRWHRLAVLVGLERRTRRVDLDSYLRKRYGPARTTQDARPTADAANHAPDHELVPAGDGEAATGHPEPERC